MNKLAELFSKAGQGSPQSFGFGLAAADGQSPRAIVLIGLVDARGLAKRSALLEADVDAILVDCAGKPLAKSSAAALEGKLWGAGMSGFSQESVESLKEQGCDFLVFDPGSTSATALGDDDFGSIIIVPSDLDRETARAIQAIKVTGAYLTSDLVGRDITVAGLIQLQRVRSLIDGPFVTFAPESPSVSDLTALRDAGVTGLSVRLEDEDAIGRLCKSMEGIAPKRRSTGARDWRALAPQSEDAEE
jgi:hypothetical protein